MKKIICFKSSILLLLAGVQFQAQAQSQSWSTAGNSVQTTPVLGTINCSDISVRTSNYERLRILCNGVMRAGGNTTQTDTNANTSMVFGSDNVTARLDVNGFANKSSTIINANVRYSGNSNVYAIKASSNPATGYGYGVYADAGRRAIQAYNYAGTYSGTTYGTYSYSNGSAGTRYGSYGYSSGSGTATCYGLKGYAFNSGSGIQCGIYADVSSSGTGTKYGLYANAPTAGSGLRYAGWFQGTVYATTLIQGSDRKLKENIRPSEGMLERLMKLNPSEYHFKKEYISSMSMPSCKQFGLIADELEQVFPELVSENMQAARYDAETEEKISEEIKFKAVNYIGLIPVVIQGVKEQQNEIEQVRAENEILKSEIEIMKSKMERIENLLAAGEMNTGAIKTSGFENSARLEQNRPNPFTSSTEIRYTLPVVYKTAVLNVYGNSQSPIHSFDLSSSQNGLVVLQAGMLVSGEYVYELIVDGKRVDMKKMTITK